MSPGPSTPDLDTCRRACLDLLLRNLTPQGILAASRTEAAEARRYTRIFGRDAAICVLAMCGSGEPALEQGALDSLDALAAQQARNGQIAKFVDPRGQDADFWYLGCIDATLWWLIAADHVRRASALPGARGRWHGEIVEVARGNLSHWVTISGGKVERYQAVVPTTWLAGGRDAHGKQGPYEESLAGNGKHPLARKEQPLEPLRTIHSFDPCMSCAVHILDPEGGEGFQVVTP